MELSDSVVGSLLIISIVLSIAAIATGALAIQSQRRVRATYSRFARGRREDVVTLLGMHIDEVQQLQRDVRRQQAYGRQLRALMGRTLSRVGTVRYDAFDDMGGRLSFSIALLDEHGDGSVITAMNGRVQTRTYAKPVEGGTSTHNLSEEEVQAIAQAMDSGRKRTAQAFRAASAPTDSSTDVQQQAPDVDPDTGPNDDTMVPDRHGQDADAASGTAIPSNDARVGNDRVGNERVGNERVGDQPVGGPGQA